MSWNFESQEPVYIQIADRLLREILSGKYPPETPFPSVRTLATEASVNPNTMQRALSLLDEEGLLVSHGTAGRQVTNDRETLDTMKRKLAQKEARAFIKRMETLGITKREFDEIIKNEGEILK